MPASITPAVFDASATYLMPLDYGLLSITGPDAVKFLQGQVTCDVRELASDKTLLGAQCNIKGRMLLCFRAMQPQAEQIYLRVHKDLIDKGTANFGKYIVFSKAKLADLRGQYQCVGVAGPAAKTLIESVFNIAIAEDNHWQLAGEHKIIRLSENRYECWLAGDIDAVIKALGERSSPGDHNLWTLLNIQAGLGDITTETYELFTPQAINFQLVNGINFRKGCYTGQEIVARLHYRGTLKRHMYRFASEFSELPTPGSQLFTADGKAVGDVVLAAFSEPNRGELLASVVDDERADLYLANNPQKLSLLALPYAIPTQNEDA